MRTDPSDTGGLFAGRRPGTAPVRFRAIPNGEPIGVSASTSSARSLCAMEAVHARWGSAGWTGSRFMLCSGSCAIVHVRAAVRRPRRSSMRFARPVRARPVTHDRPGAMVADPGSRRGLRGTSPHSVPRRSMTLAGRAASPRRGAQADRGGVGAVPGVREQRQGMSHHARPASATFSPRISASATDASRHPLPLETRECPAGAAVASVVTSLVRKRS